MIPEHIIDKPCILKHLDVSTAHITPDDNIILGNIISNRIESFLSVYDSLYGYVIVVGEEINYNTTISAILKEGFSTSFCNLLRQARKNDCCYLSLDCDGTIYEEIPQYDF